METTEQCSKINTVRCICHGPLRCEELLTSGEGDVSIKVLEFLQQLSVDFLQLLLPPALIHSFSLRLVPEHQNIPRCHTFQSH